MDTKDFTSMKKLHSIYNSEAQLEIDSRIKTSDLFCPNFWGINKFL